MKTLIDLAAVREQIRIQGSNGNWNHDPYMLGMYNGMECVIATLEGRPPQYRKVPRDGFICDRAKHGFKPTVADVALPGAKNAKNKG